MGRVRLEILPGLGDAFGGRREGYVHLEESIEAGATVGDVLTKLATRYKAFRAMAFDTASDRLSGHVAIVLNDQLLEALEGMGTRLQDGDTIRLFPVIAGG